MNQHNVFLEILSITRQYIIYTIGHIIGLFYYFDFLFGLNL